VSESEAEYNVGDPEQTLNGYDWCTEEMWGEILKVAHQLKKDPFEVLEAIDAVSQMSPEHKQAAAALAARIGRIFEPLMW